MRGIANRFSISTEYVDSNEISFAPGSIYIHCVGHEERSNLLPEFEINHPDIATVTVVEHDDQSITLTSAYFIDERFLLRSQQSAKRLTEILDSKDVYVDITGLTHSSWCWLIKVMLEREVGQSFAVYAEPLDYKFHHAPFEGQIYDLSEKITGIAPLPGFAKLTRYSSEDFIFMPLLGFEGARFAHIFEDVQPSKSLTFPVIGVPGFQYDFPFSAYQGNKLLEREGLWRNWRYEKANCPASIFSLGEEFLAKYPDKDLRLAPIGTKPHALGAILLKLCYPSKVDIVYDHPVRKIGRTTGKSKTICYTLHLFKSLIHT